MLSPPKSWNAEPWKKVRWWRGRSGELRQTAEAMSVPWRRDGLVHIADDYERMAADLERNLKERGIFEQEA